MRNRTPVPRDARPPLPAFTPVPRKYGHDGWTPERQKAFIEALADCGSVTRRPMAQINMAQANCYTLRRAPEAGEEPMTSANIGNIRRSRSRASRTLRWGLGPPAARPSGRSTGSSTPSSAAASGRRSPGAQRDGS